MTDIIAKIRVGDGKLVELLSDGIERLLPVPAAAKPASEDDVAAASADPDVPSLAGRHLRPVPRVKTLRRALGLSQEQFALRYHIPLGTLRDWEQGRSEPDAPARAYLKVIAVNPDSVVQALEVKPTQAISP